MQSSIKLRRLPARGLTLIEVLAGLALMATILVAMLALKARFTHQVADSGRRLRGIAAADSLLEQWWADPATFPVNRSGTIPQFPGFYWRTELVQNGSASELNARVVRLDVLADAKTISSVELLLPLVKHNAQ